MARLDSKTREYIREYRESADSIPESAVKLVDQRRSGIGQVYYTIGQDIYIADHTGSDVPEWALQYYSLADELDADPSNADIIAMLTADEPRRPEPRLTLCACGHYSASPMNASLGTSCPDCYDRMSD